MLMHKENICDITSIVIKPLRTDVKSCSIELNFTSEKKEFPGLDVKSGSIKPNFTSEKKVFPGLDVKCGTIS